MRYPRVNPPGVWVRVFVGIGTGMTAITRRLPMQLPKVIDEVKKISGPRCSARFIDTRNTILNQGILSGAIGALEKSAARLSTTQPLKLHHEQCKSIVLIISAHDSSE